MTARPPPLRASNRSSRLDVRSDVGSSGEDVREITEIVDDDDLRAEEEEGHGLWNLLYGAGSFGVSMLFHLAAMILLAYLTVPPPSRLEQTLVEASFSPLIEDEPVEVELDEDIRLVDNQLLALFSAAPHVGLAADLQGSAGPPQLDVKVLEQARAEVQVGEVHVEYPLASAPTFERLVEAVPDGEFKGEPRAIIDNYQQAMDRITQELMWKMDRGPVLVIWAFDQSESMKDDQQEIRDRVHNVYAQLGLLGRERGDWLTTSIVSYGEGFQTHTRLPTSDIEEIRSAIAAVPEDRSGREMMCQAVAWAIAQHREYARATKHQMVLILVTDESGEREDNVQNLEAAIAEAKAARCTIYVLGREAVFGYPLAYMRWEHPQTHDIHWLPVDRGPETAFVEQLQTDGFRRRHDAFPSGFGPYEQCRLARETGGIFFLLPSLESSLVRGEKRVYELEVMRPYRPDLHAREELLRDRDRYPLRSIMWQCIYELDPLQRPELANQIEMRVHFSPTLEQFVRQARQEQAKAKNFLVYLARVQKALEKGAHHRTQEADPRWQANYDLIYAQLVAYQARIWEYDAALEAFIKEPKVVPLTKPPDLRLVHWNVTVRSQTLTKESGPYIERAAELFRSVMENHPGTPWAGRAHGELQRGFGVDFVPEYRRVYPEPPKGSKLAPIPKL
ncbi:MAG TPA: VWA domain-containing protein [Candidatus Anammoximicrobium sp.]|nr:VWA domain-containing protein [Candidatus Anammoximicrobium sp.]